MPDMYGLYELSTFIVKTSDVVKELQLMWWEQITKFSSRDQISFPFCLWKLDKKCKCGSENCRGKIKSIQFLPKEIFHSYIPHIPKYFQKVYIEYHKKNNGK